MDTFGCALPMDEGNALIDNSEAGELVENNSQWHPGFSDIGSVPGNLSIGTVPPTSQTVAQTTAVTIADPDFLDHDESETEDEADEDMDEIDDVDDAFDEDALDEEDLLQPFDLGALTSEPLLQAHNPDAVHVFPDEGPFDLHDLEPIEMPAPLTYEQLLEGNA